MAKYIVKTSENYQTAIHVMSSCPPVLLWGPRDNWGFSLPSPALEPTLLHPPPRNLGGLADQQCQEPQGIRKAGCRLGKKRPDAKIIYHYL